MIDLRKYFEAAFILTDVAFTERHKFVAQQCVRLNMPISFHCDMTRKPYGYSQYLRITQTPESALGEIGCAMTHYTCWEKCLAIGYQSVLFLEDDVIVRAAANQILTAIMENAPADWTVLYLGVNRLQNILDRQQISRHLVAGKTNFYSHLGGAWAYALSHRGLKYIVRTFESDNQKMRSDGMLYETISTPLGNGYVAIPQAFRHAGLPSEIGRMKVF